jgi:hypothetical protein
LQQEIAEALDYAARKYYEETPEKDRTTLGVTTVMRAVAKSKQQSFKGQFSKFTAVANPKFGDGFLDEVSLLCIHPSQISPLFYGALTLFFTPYRSQNTGAALRSQR